MTVASALTTVAAIDARPEPAGVRVGLLTSGLAAFAARVRAARSATRRLDLQYYIWRDDVTGRLLAREALRAAERGVQVRLLLDDMYAIGGERLLSILDAHPHIEVRLFNATTWRRFGQFGFLLEMLFGGWHLNRRMHNKAWIVDSRIAILGGRNVGDEYFDASDTFNFRDLDLTIMGPAADSAGDIFERYWHHPLSRPVSEICQAPHRRRGGLRGLARRLDRAATAPDAKPFLRELDTDPTAAAVLKGDPSILSTVPGGVVRLLSDPPDKVTGRAPATEWLAPVVLDLLRSATREALLVSPYFVPGEEGAALLSNLAASGVRVSVITNSLAATDVVAVHGGYARYREGLLRAGVVIHELRPSGEEGASLLGSRGASLHTKALVVDGARAMVGSFNLDPRSRALNTETGTIVDDPSIAQGIVREHARLSEPARSWRVSLDGDGRLIWVAAENGEQRVWRTEPGASRKRRALAWLVGCVPIESQL
ncbi:phospholipase D family protein [Muricoccus radiodurans]|uniref:phospholipase D family protein n=1 Tax=Muricoccus radiodurans TaxID=2231721 RepID=UPI003CEC7333